MSHLQRDLQYLIELYPQYQWAIEMKVLIEQALELKKELTTARYYSQCEERQRLKIRLEELLRLTLNENHCKARTLQKNLLKHQQYILYFLYNPEVPPDNNGSERAIKNIKVKISGQFKSDEGANGFATLRSVIDTTIKSGQNVLNALSLIAKLGTE
jgi:transposase